MQGRFALLVLLIAFSFVSAQFPATPFTPLVRSLSIQDTPLVNQQLPPCYSVDYVVATPGTPYQSTGSVIQANVYFLEFTPTTASNITLPTQPVTIQLFWRAGNTGVLNPIQITSEFTTTVNGTSYGSCTYTNSLATYTSGSSSSCGLNYYCAGIKELNQVQGLQYVVRITTSSGEQQNGIIFNVKLAQRLIPATIIQWNVPTTISSQTPTSGVNLFIPTQFQQDFYVEFVPKGQDVLSVAQYYATASGLVDISFRVYNVLVNGLNTTSTSDWSLAVNEGDLAVSNIQPSTVDFPTNCASIGRNDTESINSSGYVEIRTLACSLLFDDAFISVGLPQTTSTSYTYTVIAQYVGTNTVNFITYVPTFTTISANNTIIPSMVGNNVDFNFVGNAYKQDNYWLNLQSSTINSNTYVFVTIFGIAPSYVQAQLTQNGLGFESSCPSTMLIDECSNYNQASTGDLVRDYCKMQITSCQYAQDGNYFVSVGGSSNILGNYYDGSINSGNGQQLTSAYSILVQLFTIEPIQIQSLSSTIKNGFQMYTDINYVAELKYNHYVININSASINQFSYMIAQVYANREQTGLSLYYNQGNLAGSDSTTYDYYGNDYYSPDDGCYNAIRSCTTSINGQTNTSVPSPPVGASTCSFVLLYCDLIPGGNLYFSVFGHLVAGIENPNSLTYRLGYNRSVSYTINFSYRTTPELLFDRITNVQHMPKNLFGDAVQSHQFLLQVPLPSTGELYSRVQVAFHAFQHQCAKNQLYTLYMGCMPTGPCPCYQEEQSISLNSAFTHYIRLESDLCSCPSGSFYISVVSFTGPGCNQQTSYQLTPFFQAIDLIGDYTYNSINPLAISTTGIMYVTEPILEPNAFFGFTQTAYNVYRIQNSNEQTSSDALNVQINYAHYVNNADLITNIVGYLVRDTPSTSLDCAVDTCAPYAPEWYYQNRYYVSTYYYFYDQLNSCNLRVDSCHFTAGTYYVILSLQQINGLSSEVSKATVDYTISIQTEDWSPVTLTINRPIRDTVATRQYKHYQLPASSVVAGSSLRISVYLNQATKRMISLYLNYDSLAGSPTNCYDFISQCNFGSATYYYKYYINEYYSQYYENDFSPAQYCDFFFDSCEIPSSGTLFVSVYSGHNFKTPLEVSERFFYNSPGAATANNVVPAMDQEYTIVAETQSVTPISLTLGYPTTGLLLYGQSTYYSFTVDTANYSPLVLQVQSIEPFPFTISNNALIETLVSFTPQTGSSATGNCHCNGDFYLNGFSDVIYNCNNLVAGTYYMTVRSSFVAIYTPVSYTVRAYYRPRRLNTLTLQTNADYTNATFTAVPTLMNYNDIQDFSISFSNTANSVLYVAIADVSYWNTSTPYVVRYLDAYLNFGYPGSPECYDQYESIQNQIIEQPNGQIMWVFHVPPCQACSGTWYLSIFARFQQPQPAPQYRLNFTVAAWSVPIAVPPSFAASTTFRTDALSTTGYDYTWPELTTSGNVYCDSRFSVNNNNYLYNYYFLTTSLQVNQYETLSIGYNSIVGNSNLRFYIKQSTPADVGACLSCQTFPSSDCNYGCIAVTAAYYGAFGFNPSSDCSTPLDDTVEQETLTFVINDDNLYTINSAVVNVNVNGTTTSTLNGRTITRFLFSFTGVDLSQWSDFSWDYTITGSSSSNGACFNVGSTGASFPPDSCANDCNTPVNNINFDACCIDTTDTFVLTVYNQDQTTSNTALVTITTSLTPNAYPVLQVLTIANTAPTSASAQFSSPNPNYYKFYTFNLIIGQNWQTDYVVDLQVFITSGSGSTTVYLNNGEYAAAPDNCFVGSIFSCTTSGSSDNNCNVQFPPCLVNQAGTYYLGLISSATTSNLFIYAQPTALFTTSSTGFSPELSSATNSFYTHRKFVYIRTIGDVGLSYQDASYQVSLRTNTLAQVLELSIHNPFAVSSNAGNFLAGNSGVNSISTPSCPYQHDTQWQCTGSGRQTDSVNGTVTCTVSLCTSNTANTYTDVSGAIYVAVRNTQSGPSVTGFTLSAGVVNLGTQPSSVQLITLNTINSATDQLFTTTCTSGTSLSGGCTYPSSSSISTVYFNIPITSSNWNILDYLMINITSISGSSISVNAWPADLCEPSSSSDLQCTSGSLTQPCILGGSPTTFTQAFRSDPGNNQVISPFVRNFWVRVSGIGSSTTFQIQARQVVPVTAVRSLSRETLSISESWVMWNYRYLMYNIITPSGGDYTLDYTVTASCFTSGNAPGLFVNFDQYRWADDITYERDYSLSPSASDSVDSCDIVNGGNVFFTILTDVDSVNFPGTQINEGVIAPQVRITFSASLTFHSWTNIPWQCPQTLPTLSGVYTYVAIGDAENFGSQIAFGFNNCPGCSLLIISPLYRETFEFISQASTYGETIQPIPQATWDTEYIWHSSSSSCTLPDSTSTGVYSLISTGTSDQTQTITIPACSYRNGRYFIQLTKPTLSQATIWTTISRKTIPVLSVLSPLTSASITSTIRNSLFYNGGEYYYEYFQVAITRSQTLKFRAEILISRELEIFPTGIFKLAGYLTRGISNLPITSSGCSQFTCVTTDPTYSVPFLPCQLYDNLCDVGIVPSDTLYYYVGVSGVTSPGCGIIPYELSIQTQLPVYSDLTAGVAVCDTIHPAAVPIQQVGEYRQTGNNERWNLGRYLNFDFNPQFINVYRLDLTGIKFATLEIRTQALGVNYDADSNGDQFQYYVSYSSQVPRLNYKTNGCGNCINGPYSYSGVVEQDIRNVIPAISITCGLGDVVYINVISPISLFGLNEIGDYQLLATLQTRNLVALTGNSPSANYTVDTVFSFNNAQTQQVIENLSTNPQLLKVTTGDNPVLDGSLNCEDGCPIADASCSYLSQPLTYYFVTDYTNSPNPGNCHTTTPNPQVLSLDTYPINVLPQSNVVFTVGETNPIFFVRTFTAAEMSTSSSWRVRITSLNRGTLTVAVGCGGAVSSSDAGCGYFVESFTTSSTLEGNVYQMYGTDCQTCSSVWVTVTASSDCDMNGYSFDVTSSFSLVVELFPNGQTQTGTALQSTWQAGAIERYAQSLPLQVSTWTVSSSTSSGFIHVGIGNVNGTVIGSVGPVDTYGHVLILDVYLNGCIVGTCSSGLTAIANPSRYNNNDYSCFVSIPTSTVATQQTYLAAVSVSSSNPISPVFASANFRIQAFNSYTDLSDISSFSDLIQGRSRHYYSVRAMNSGTPISVVVNLNIVDGPRLLLTVADTPDYMTSYQDLGLTYDGWFQQKICPFSSCTIEIPTLASHPRVPVLYIWVTTVPTDTDDWRTPEEKPTNYIISGSIGTENCIPASQALVGPFCSSVNITNAPGGVWFSRTASSILDSEAECTYNGFLCRCVTPSQTCQNALKEFACLEPFVGCDSQGFKIAKCRSNCQYVVDQCGDWTAQPNTDCDCQSPQFNCDSAYYASSAPCSGSDIVSTSSSVQVIGFVDTTLTAPTSLDCATPSPSPTTNPLFSASPTPSPNGPNSSSSTLTFSNLLFVVCAFILVWFA